jgi:hypothetical protein
MPSRRDAYVEDDPFDENGVMKDGRSYRFPAWLCDSRMRYVPDVAAHSEAPAPALHYFGMGYCFDGSRTQISDATALWYQLRDDLQNEWKRHQPPPLHDTNQIMRPDPPAPRPWPKGGYGTDPNTEGTTNWPNPDTLQSMAEGDECTVNGAPGKLVRVDGKLVCKARQDMDAQTVRDVAWMESISNIENEWQRWR